MIELPDVMTKDLMLLWAAAIPLIFSPGPANLSLASIGVAHGFRRGLPYLTGIVLGTTTVLLLVALGLTAVILAQPLLAHSLKLLAGIYIVYLAWKIATAPAATSRISGSNSPTASPGLVLAIANPKAFAAIGAVYAGQSLVEGHVLADALLKISALTVVIVLSALWWLSLGSALSKLFVRPRINRAVNVAFALLLILSVGAALVT